MVCLVSGKCRGAMASAPSAHTKINTGCASLYGNPRTRSLSMLGMPGKYSQCKEGNMLVLLAYFCPWYWISDKFSIHCVRKKWLPIDWFLVKKKNYLSRVEYLSKKPSCHIWVMAVWILSWKLNPRITTPGSFTRCISCHELPIDTLKLSRTQFEMYFQMLEADGYGSGKFPKINFLLFYKHCETTLRSLCSWSQHSAAILYDHTKAPAWRVFSTRLFVYSSIDFHSRSSNGPLPWWYMYNHAYTTCSGTSLIVAHSLAIFV